jgi:hypothetical protein
MTMDPGALISYNIKVMEDDLGAWLPADVLKSAMEEALVLVEQEIQGNFDTRQGQWQPLAMSTQMQRLRQGYGPNAPILERSGTLRDNVASGHEVSVSSDEISGGTFPNDDATAPYSKVPIGDYLEGLNEVRNFYDLDEGQQSKIFEKFVEIISDKLGLK